MFITFEGIEGSGKSTVQQKLAKHFTEMGHEVVCTREPGGSQLGQTLRSILLHTESHICSEAELFLFLADRAQHVAEVIRPALTRNALVLCDRYTDSTLAYQGAGRGLSMQGLETLKNLNTTATGGLIPHMTLLLDLPVHEGLARAHKRNAELCTKQEDNEGRFDNESLAFHTKVQQQYLACAKAEPQRFVIIDASLDAHSVFTDCLQACIKKYTLITQGESVDKVNTTDKSKVGAIYLRR